MHVHTRAHACTQVHLQFTYTKGIKLHTQQCFGWMVCCLNFYFIFYSHVCICLGLCTSAHRKPRRPNEDIRVSEAGMTGHVLCLVWVPGRNSTLSPESSRQPPSLLPSLSNTASWSLCVRHLFLHTPK